MHINKPKPWCGWRELGKELGTIVLNMLIALGSRPWRAKRFAGRPTIPSARPKACASPYKQRSVPSGIRVALWPVFFRHQSWF